MQNAKYANKIIENEGLDYQAFDGGAAGVQATIKDQAKYNFYIHCLKLTWVDVVKPVPQANSLLWLKSSMCSLLNQMSSLSG